MTTSLTTSLKLDAGIKARVRRLAQARRRSSHWLMREAIEQYVEREERREQLRRDATAAWAEYQATGQHVTSVEVDAWLVRLEAGKAADPTTPLSFVYGRYEVFRSPSLSARSAAITKSASSRSR